MDVSKKRKRDVDYPRITYDATTKVFDRLFKEESLEEMKNVVRKKLGLSSSLPVHLSQLRDGKSVVLEDDDDFDAFYASIHLTPVAKIKVHFGDHQPPPASTAGPDASFTGDPTQILESPMVHPAVADGHSLLKKRKVSFVESISESLGDNIEKPSSSQPSPNFAASAEAPAIIDVIPAGAREAHETGNDTKKKRRKKDKVANPTLEGPSLRNQVQSDIAVVEASGSNLTKTAKGQAHVSEHTPYNTTKSKKRPRTSTTDKSVQPVTGVLDSTTAPGIDDTGDYPKSSKKSKHKHKNSEDLENAATDLTDDNQVDTRTKSPEESERHTASNGPADPSEGDVLTRPPKLMNKSRKKKEVDKESDVDLSATQSAKSRSSNSEIVVRRAKKQDSQLPASTFETINSKGKTKNPEPYRSLNTPTKPGLNEDETGFEEETMSSASVGGKTVTKKTSKKEAPVEPPKSNSAQDQAPSSDVMTAVRDAVDAILARKSLLSKGSEQIPTYFSPLVDVTASSSLVHIPPVTSSSSPDDQPEPPNNASITAGQPKAVPKCPICDQTPSHVRSRCPIIKAGIRSMRQRIAELQRDAPEGSDEEREKVIEELGRIIDKKSKRKTPPAENKSTNVKSTANKTVISPTPAVDSSPVAQPPKTSQAVKPAKAPSPMRIAESFEFGGSDASLYTAQDLEALIRGPNVSLADVPSSDSSEDDEEVLEEEYEEVQDNLSRSQGRIRYPSSSEEEEEEEEEASPFVSSIIPLPIKSASELSNEDESSRSEDFGDNITSFHEVNDLGSSLEVDKTGNDAVNDAYGLDSAYLNAPELSENGRKAVIDDHILSAVDESQVLGESVPKTVSDVAEPPVTMASPQSDPIEASEKPESPLSPIVSIEEDTHPLQSTPKAEVAVRRSQRNNSTLVRKTTTTSKPHSASQTGVNGVNGTSNNSKLAKKTGGLTRITDLPIPINPAIRVIKPAGVQTRRQAARAEEGEEKVDEQGPTNASQAKPRNGKSPASKTSPKTTKKIAITPAKVPVASNGENLKTQSVTVVQDVLETMDSVPGNGEQSLASWAVLQGNSQPENESLGMVDELHSSPNTLDLPPSAQKPTSPTVAKGRDPLFLHSESQQSFPYSQYPGFAQEPPDSEDEEDEVEASVVKSQTKTRNSSKFRSLTEIASQPTLFTPTLHIAQTINAKEKVTNLYGRANKEEESEDSDTESESEAEAKAQTSHIPMSRRAGISVSKRG